MRKYILLLITAISFAQAPSRFPNGVSITGGQPTITSATFLTATDPVSGQQLKIDPVNLPFPKKIVVYSTDFDPVLSQYPDGLDIKKRNISPEINRLDPLLTPIYSWGDSLTQGIGGTPYTTNLASLSGFTITNKGIGGETSTQIKDRMIAEPANYSKSVIIWAGRNNYTSPTTVKSDIATMIAALGHDRYLVVSILNGDYLLEYKNGTNWNTIKTLNNDLKNLYGNKYVEVREFLVSQHDQSTQDLIDFANDIPPTSLRSDNIHLNTLGYTKVAEFLNQRLGNLYGLNGYLQSKDIKYYTDLYKEKGADKQVVFWTGTTTQSGTNNFVWDNLNKRLGIGANMGTTPSTVFQVLDTQGGVFFDGRDVVYNRFKSTGTTTGTSRPLMISAQTSGVTPDLYMHVSGGISMGNTTDPGANNLSISGKASAGVAASASNDLMRKNEVDAADALKANLASPSLTGTPTAPTATAGTNTTQIATTAFVTSAISTGSTSATYTPTLTNTTNISSSTLTFARYSKVGKLVTAYVSLSLSNTAAAVSSRLKITLPTTAVTSSAFGTGLAYEATIGVTQSLIITSSGSSTQVDVDFVPSATLNRTLLLSFSYMEP